MEEFKVNNGFQSRWVYKWLYKNLLSIHDINIALLAISFKILLSIKTCRDSKTSKSSICTTALRFLGPTVGLNSNEKLSPSSILNAIRIVMVAKQIYLSHQKGSQLQLQFDINKFYFDNMLDQDTVDTKEHCCSCEDYIIINDDTDLNFNTVLRTSIKLAQITDSIYLEEMSNQFDQVDQLMAYATKIPWPDEINFTLIKKEVKNHLINTRHLGIDETLLSNLDKCNEDFISDDERIDALNTPNDSKNIPLNLCTALIHSSEEVAPNFMEFIHYINEEFKKKLSCSMLNNHSHNIRIKNVVSSLNLGCNIDLIKLMISCRNADYNPFICPSLTMRILEPNTSILVYSNGTILCVGAMSIEESVYALKLCSKIIQKVGFQIKCSNAIILNIIAASVTGFPINMRTLSKACKNAHFKENGPTGVINYNMEDPKINIQISYNGNLVFFGGKSENEIHCAKDKICALLNQFKDKDVKT